MAADQRAEVGHLGKGVHRVMLHYGFMEQPEVPRDLAPLTDRGIPIDPMRTSYFIGRNSYVGAARPVLPRWQQQLFLVLVRFAVSAADFFGLPANRTVELGSRIEMWEPAAQRICCHPERSEGPLRQQERSLATLGMTVV